MTTLVEVETARALMTEAMSWSVMRWLREKKSVRKTADQANAVLDQFVLAVRQRWPVPLRVAYDALGAQPTMASTHKAKQPSATDAEAIILAERIKRANDAAFRARMDAEECFDQAEKRLSTALAREGCKKAIHSWDLYEMAISKAEAIISAK